ncbi:phosphatidate cytidylyltransferase [Pedobacter sp. P351]|uniref:phosphatidate cytidylyltransferase n=1 Tax=Pedobacter superstes TaxID=3133441 RepID=UPI003099CA2E
MRVRAITGFFFVIVMLGSLLLGQYTFALFFIVLSLLCLVEFYRLVKTETIRPHRSLGVLLAGTLITPLVLNFLFNDYLYLIFLTVPAAIAICIVELFRNKEHPFINLAFTYFGILFIIIPFCFFTAMAFMGNTFNFHFPLAFMLMLWANDTGAYIFGVSFGKHKLFERHSPKKTWEGFFGGLATGLLAAYIIGTQFHDLTLVQWFIVSAIVGIAGTFGDLFESMLKRSISIKDSGSLLPGHGGLLDRFDGLLFAAPLVFIYLYSIIFLG